MLTHRRRKEKKNNKISGKSDCLRAGMLASVPLKEESEIRIEKEKKERMYLMG